jgi:hypothetical protein
MRKIGFIIGLVVATIVFFSCKREKKEFIGPELGIASSNFQIVDAFVISDEAIDFGTDSNWFKATFNEHVSWEVNVKGLQSKATKTFKGTSKFIDRTNSEWTGGHSGQYFFLPGEQIVSELTVFGITEKWYDTSTVVAEKKQYGSDVIVWWDMNVIGVAAHGIGAYWFDFYDGDAPTPTVGVGERLLDKIENSPRTDNDPIQGIYRSIEGKDGLGASNYYIGGCGNSPLSSQTGFNESLDNIYLNIYLRRRTNTTGTTIGLSSTNASSQLSEISYNVGEITWEGWKLVSIRLSDMPLKAGNPPFDPTRITNFFANLQIVSGPGVDQTGIDIDFITITKGGPFNPNNY